MALVAELGSERGGRETTRPSFVAGQTTAYWQKA